MPAAVVRNHTIPMRQEKHHLRIPVIRRKWPAVMENQRLSRPPVLVEYFSSVFRRDGVH